MASFQTQCISGHQAQEPGRVCISRTEYDALNSIARRYANLCRNLRQGGVGEDAIALLSTNDSLADTTQPFPDPQTTSSSAQVDSAGSFHRQDGSSYARDPETQLWHIRHGSSSSEQQRDGDAWVETDNDPYSDDASVVLESLNDDKFVFDHGLSAGHSPAADSGLHEPQRHDKRSVHISGLPDNATHADITAIVRGGQLLDVYLRHRDRAATVAFLYGSDAKAFIDFSRRNDQYIKNKRVEIRWADRHFTLPGHVAHKVRFGVSRNLIIRRCDPNHTEEALREDLEHIHNLVVIKVEFVHGDCFISTNSIHNAMFARTCMMSRQKYKGSKIEWGDDECAEPLPQLPAPKRSRVSSVPVPLNPLANRFQLLELDEGTFA